MKRKNPPGISCSRTPGVSLPPHVFQYVIVYIKSKSIFSRGGKMSIRKEELHLLVDLVDDRDTKFVYDLISVVIEKEIVF